MVFVIAAHAPCRFGAFPQHFSPESASSRITELSDIFTQTLTLSAFSPTLQTLEAMMTDGPFRNSALSNKWKQYGRDLVNDAASQDERAKQASHSVLGAIDTKAFDRLYRELDSRASRDQMDLDSVAATESIFDNDERSCLGDALERNLLCNLREGMSEREWLDAALGSAVSELLENAKNRIHEECLRARDVGDMSRSDFAKGIQRNRETFASIDVGSICAALENGNKNAFRRTARTDVNDGPDED
jgi:hypothetical protein